MHVAPVLARFMPHTSFEDPNAPADKLPRESIGSGSNDALTRALRTGTQDTINQSGQQIVRRQLNVTPTLTIRPGFPVRVIVTRDLILAPIGDRR